VLAVKIVAEKDWLEKRGGEETVEVWLLLSGRGPKDWAADLYSDSETAGGRGKVKFHCSVLEAKSATSGRACHQGLCRTSRIGGVEDDKMIP